MTTNRPTYRWTGLVLASLGLAGLGAVLGKPVVFAAAAVPLVFVAYAHLAPPPTLEVSITREFDDPAPAPGDEVEVRLSVTNTSDRLLPDLRVVDGVPDELGVIKGSPRLGTTLAPGDTATARYTVVARQGRYTFSAPEAVALNIGGARLVSGSVGAAQTLECSVPIEEVPLGQQTARNVGRLPADTGGSGIEFHSVRDYRHNDPQSRVDWRRFARSGELTTVNFREERAATVHLLLDETATTQAAIDPQRPTAAEYGVYAGDLAFRALLAQGNRVGVGFHPTDSVALPVGAGPDHDVRGRQLFQARSGPSTSATDGDGAPADLGRTRADGSGVVSNSGFDLGTWGDDARSDGHETGGSGTPGGPRQDVGATVRSLAAELPRHAQVIYISPLYEDAALDIIDRLQTRGFEVTVLSPDPGGATDRVPLDGRMARLERQVRLRRLLGRGVRVVDWSTDDPLQLVVARALEGVNVR